MGAVVDDAADDGEEQAGDDAVREHLQDCAGDADLVKRHEAEEHEAHVADAGIADDEFEVGLRESDQCAVDDADDGEDCEDVTPGTDADERESPGVEAVREEPDANAEAAICAELHDYSGEEHGGGGGRGYVAGGRPGVEGPHAGEDRKAGEYEREAPHLEADGQAGVRKIDEAGGVAACGGVGGEQSDEHHG